MKDFFFFFLLFIPFSLFTQSIPNLNTIEKVVESHSQYEKIYVHTDRDYYTGGGDIFFKVYLTDAALLQQKASSKVAYIDLIDADKKVVQSKIVAIQNGQGIGDFSITSKYKSGNYVLRAYTAYMKNFDADFFFRKTIYIRSVSNIASSELNATKKIAVQFFPEGGDLVDGLTSKIGVKATDKDGFGVQLEGKIVTPNQGEMITVSTNENGFGQLLLTPENGASYTFKGNYDGETIEATLPTPLKEGGVLSLDNKEEEKIKVQINTNVPQSMEHGYLIGQAMGKVFFKEEIENATTANFELDGYDIPFGVLHFTLFDNTGRPRAERLIFNHVGIDNFNVDISADKTTYEKREKVKLKLDVFDDNGDVLETDLSLSVRSNYLERAAANNDNIQSYLLLSSDIKGVIENPKTYFKDNEKTTKANLDLLLLTQGWRRFTWQDALKMPAKKMLYAPEQGLSILGRITEKEAANKPVKAVGFLSELSANLSLIDFETDTEGQFSIDGIQIVNEMEMVLQAAVLDKKQKKVKKGSYMLKGNRKVNIEIEEKMPMSVGVALPSFFQKTNQQKENLTSLSNLENISYKNDLAYEDGDFSIEIDSVEVTATKVDNVIKHYEDGMLYSRPDTRLKFDEQLIDPNIRSDVLSILLGKAPGVNFDPTTGSIIVRGRKSGLSGITAQRQSARFMVNGSFVSDDYAMSINPTNIAFIDILRSYSQLTIFGEAGNNGLIMIYLKTPEYRKKTIKEEVDGIKNFTIKGYNQARTFYAPVYTELNRAISKADNRVMLHWTPTVQFNELGEAFVEFFTSDRIGNYDIIVEGISKDGLPIFAQSKIIVE